MILLSILIPSLPERAPKLAELLSNLPLSDPRLEVMILTDNRRRQLGAKRNKMMDMAQGRFICHIDDDEKLSDNFFNALLPELEKDVDVIGYNAGVSFNGGPEFRVTTTLRGPNQQPRDLGNNQYSDITRTYWHWCAWRTELAKQYRFPEDKGWAEDAIWLEKILPNVKSHIKIERILFHHRWSSESTCFATTD